MVFPLSWRPARHFRALIAGGEPITPKTPPPPAPNALPPEPPLVTYPTVTPATSMSATSIAELRHLKAANGVTRIPTPNLWFPIDLYQGTITRQQFEEKLHTLFDPFGVFTPYLDINDSRVIIYPSATDHRLPQFTLNFAPPGKPVEQMRWFRTPEEMRAVTHPLDKPLYGLRVAIDPGHIGGPWAQMEERSTRYRGSAPVQEGDLNLITARILKQELTTPGRERLRRARLDRAGHALPPGRFHRGSARVAHGPRPEQVQPACPSAGQAESALWRTANGAHRVPLLPLFRNH